MIVELRSIRSSTSTIIVIGVLILKGIIEANFELTRRVA